MTKFMEINGVDFEIHKSRKIKNADAYIEAAKTSPYMYEDIYECYEKPSNIKVNIFKEWIEWARDFNINSDFGTHIIYMRITSFSFNQFTLGAVMYIDDKPYGLIHITKCHNCIYVF